MAALGSFRLGGPSIIPTPSAYTLARETVATPASRSRSDQARPSTSDTATPGRRAGRSRRRNDPPRRRRRRPGPRQPSALAAPMPGLRWPYAVDWVRCDQTEVHRFCDDRSERCSGVGHGLGERDLRSSDCHVATCSARRLPIRTSPSHAVIRSTRSTYFPSDDGRTRKAATVFNHDAANSAIVLDAPSAVVDGLGCSVSAFVNASARRRKASSRVRPRTRRYGGSIALWYRSARVEHQMDVSPGQSAIR